MAIRIAVTTSPCPRLLNTPNADIGATGCSTITPYKIKSHNVSDRFSRGAVLTPTSLSTQLSLRRQVVMQPGSSYLNRFKSDNSAHSCRLPQQQKFAACLAPFPHLFQHFLTCSFGQVPKSTARIVCLTPSLISAQRSPSLCSLI